MHPKTGYELWQPLWMATRSLGESWNSWGFTEYTLKHKKTAWKMDQYQTQCKGSVSIRHIPAASNWRNMMWRLQKSRQKRTQSLYKKLRKRPARWIWKIGWKGLLRHRVWFLMKLINRETGKTTYDIGETAGFGILTTTVSGYRVTNMKWNDSAKAGRLSGAIKLIEDGRFWLNSHYLSPMRTMVIFILLTVSSQTKICCWNPRPCTRLGCSSG